MDLFKKQIDEDIEFYRDNNVGVIELSKAEWAFNYWVLDKLFYVDEELIEEQIIDYNDQGVDAYVYYEDSNDLYIIQNKFYNEESRLSKNYVENDFLIRPVNALKNNSYRRSEELQNIFKKNRNKDNFTTHLQIFVTNNNRNEGADNAIKSYNKREKEGKFIASIFYLDDIKKRYFEEEEHKTSNVDFNINTIVKGTILNINNDSYKLKNVIDARYVFTPITSIFKIYRESLEKKYPIFDSNIREFLGKTGVNKNIINTLKNEEDRKNFFYYNNGITMICEQMGKINTGVFGNNSSAMFTVHNPQIVNGCQTVNSVYEVLKNEDPEDLESEYKDTFVMLKVLEIDKDSSEEQGLYKNVVKYNNSQNKIDEKNFVSNNNLFYRWQKNLEEYGLLLIVKQSDKNKYRERYSKNLSKLRVKWMQISDDFDVQYTKVSDCFVPLEKLMQVIIAFELGAQSAYIKKSSLLKLDTEVYKIATKILEEITTKQLVSLYMLYSKAEQRKKKSKDGRTPIPFYLIDCFSLYECNNRDRNTITEKLSSIDKINEIVNFYSDVIRIYAKRYFKKYEIDYNKMIKKPIDYELIYEVKDEQTY